MAKNKGARIIITLRCVDYKKTTNSNRNKKGSRKIDYTTTKKRRNKPDRLILKKYCPNCNIHTLQKEIK
ncbi:unnamed protein product [Ectocarpus fasciculatus]